MPASIHLPYPGMRLPLDNSGSLDFSKDGEALYSQQKQDQELTVAQSSRYDLNQIPHDYTVQVTNRFRGLIVVDKVFEEP